MKRISERAAAEIEGHRLFKRETDSREVRYTWTHLDITKSRTERLSIPEGERNKRHFRNVEGQKCDFTVIKQSLRTHVQNPFKNSTNSIMLTSTK